MKILAVFCLVMLLSVSTVLADEMEPLRGMMSDFDAGTITISVVSSGCTDKGSFRMDLTNDALTVFRVRKDTCNALPEKTTITFTVAEVGINPHQPFTIANPFLVNENLAGMVKLPESGHDALVNPVRGNE